MTAPYWLNPYDATDFPDVALALRDPDGLLAVGGDLSVERLLAAYRRCSHLDFKAVAMQTHDHIF